MYFFAEGREGSHVGRVYKGLLGEPFAFYLGLHFPLDTCHG